MTTKEKRVQKTQDDDLGDIFSAIGIEDPSKKAVEGKKTADDSQNDIVKQLQQQIADLNERLNRQSADQLALLTQPIDVSRQFRQQEPHKADEKLPDPITNPDEYTEALQKRILQSVQSVREDELARSSAVQQAEARADALFDSFTEQYGSYAENEDRIRFVAEKVATRAKNRGLDTDAYMFKTSDRFFKDVVKEYDAIFGKPEDASAEADDTDDAEDNSRADAVFGGQSEGKGGKKTQQENPGDMMNDIKDLQRGSGFF